MKKSTVELLSICLFLTVVHSSPAKESAAVGDGWTSLFDGKTLAGWKAGGNTETFSVRDGMVVAEGSRSHLFGCDQIFWQVYAARFRRSQ